MANAPEPSTIADDQSSSSSDEDTVKGDRDEDHIADMLDEGSPSPTDSVALTGAEAVAISYRELVEASREAASEDGSTDAIPRRAGSPIDSLLSIPDDSPSVQGSVVSSPGSSVLLPSFGSRPGMGSPTPSFRPFDQRFQSRLFSPSINSPRPSSPAFLAGHSRTVSVASQFLLDPAEPDTPAPPWEVVRWTKLMKLNGQAFSEAGKRNFGSPTCLAVSASIVLGTTKGIILVFDYNQNLKMIIGPGTKAVESGPITSVAVSADHTTIAGGHANGNIFTWDTARAARPFLAIPHLDVTQMQNRVVDGHVSNVTITHLGFLGTRHTALVSADDRGMAFSHLATRGTGALGRAVKTTRILGRYPDVKPPSGKALKPSTVLAFGSLPLGNVEMATDTLGLTAMLTPYLLVIVSTTPIAQTQHKSARPKEVAAHGAMTGCLAWFPAVKLKVADPVTGSQMSKVKLVYCWSNVLTVLDVDEIPAEDSDKPPSLRFRARSRWKCEEAIVAVQWLSRSVLTVLTISQRLIVLEDRSMRMTEAFDLIHKHIYHVDLFSKQLHNLVEQLDEEDTSMHGVVADAFYMSFKAYKGRLFLLGFNDVSLGALSNWADRLIALMENGDYVGAIRLATSYYTGDTNKLTVGLPEDTALRHSMVQDKLMEIMSASLKYVFNRRGGNRGATEDSHLQELAETCFVACQSVSDVDFVFDEMFEAYEDAGVEGFFLETLEPYILDGSITAIPAVVVKEMVPHFVSKGWEGRLEELICHMDTATLDLDQTTLLCKQHGLYDALIYVWNQALRDFITPLLDLLSLLVPLVQNDKFPSSGDVMGNDSYWAGAFKIFPYLSYALTGRVYPTGEELPKDVAQKAKAELYWFLFSGKSIAWPKGSSKRLLTKPGQSQEPSFPYLRMILKFDAPRFLSALNEAFEDSFLNDSPEKQLNGSAGRDLPEEQIFGLTVDRQYIVSILMEIMNPNEFAAEDTIYLDMFIARNLPKYPQYLLFTGSTLTKALIGLCKYPGEDLADDAQLSAEYLLSTYQPPDISELIPLFKSAGFYRILKRIYRIDKQYGKLVQTYFEDPDDREGVFDCIDICLRPQTGLTRRQVQDVHLVLKENSEELVELDPSRAAKTIARHAPELHQHVLDSAAAQPGLQYAYLKTILEPEKELSLGPPPDRELVEQYLRLMCRFDPTHVSDYVGLVQSADLRLDELLPTMEETGVIDAAVILMAKEGQVQEAMARLIKHLGTLESALQGLVAGAGSQSDLAGIQDSAEELMEALQKYTLVGIWLCQGQTKTVRDANSVRRRQKEPSKSALSADENLWLDLIETSAQITRRLSAILQPLSGESPALINGDVVCHEVIPQAVDASKLLGLLRALVQNTFTALLTSTSTQAAPSMVKGAAGIGTNFSFLRVLRAFLTRAAASSPNLADLRAVLVSIFSAYAYEESILNLSNRLLERSLFVSVSQAVELRQRGWRPRGSTCEACGRRIWGPGLAGNVFGAWEERRASEERRRQQMKTPILLPGLEWAGNGKAGGSGSGEGIEDYIGIGKGKGKDMSPRVEQEQDWERERERERETDGTDEVAEQEATTSGPDGAAYGLPDQLSPRKKDQTLGPLVVLACRHIYHQSCLEEIQAKQGPMGHAGGYGKEREYRCPIDG
ncbi:Golgi CORVET complex core vacuolar protein 8-domain-containing protein [Lasiosphaeria miniovina]|uniref:Golgi CORVET complex core vacuolar protein 8-domain-containing protein n=1 Tax=Lasiosphaeria miniovina TaxID=1954250 RepID=A0AA40BIV8_9PEZI|nr:Golgi CORVET complex core vacuolar protein 8-domain-containing protein [Lasiosphaeria miniovina]KAK0735040.1 Golgi CORVET complex core vacuolar protein 8-domain-containing protein [Lasiosphaeria miniovina]